MARFRKTDVTQTQLIPVSYESQILPSSFEDGMMQVLERIDLSILNDRFKNDETGRPAYRPEILLRIILLAYFRGIYSSRKMEQACRENVLFMAIKKAKRKLFFDRVNHDMLMSRIARRVKDRRVLKLIRLYLNSGILTNGVCVATEEGVPQGGPLSPLLSNIMLDDLDKELEKRGHKFCRYADDCNVYVRGRRSGERVKESLTRFLRDKLKLKVNEEKSAVDRPSKRKSL